MTAEVLEQLKSIGDVEVYLLVDNLGITKKVFLLKKYAELYLKTEGSNGELSLKETTVEDNLEFCKVIYEGLKPFIVPNKIKLL